MWRVIQGNALEELPKLKAESIDLVFTSPPYADLRVPGIPPEKYVEWFIPIGHEIFRVLKPNGSFILNINDRIKDGERSLYVFDLVCALKRVVGFSYIERYIWRKTKFCPRVAGPRAIDVIEYVFWFGRGTNVTFNTDALRRPYAPATIKRGKYGYTALSKRIQRTKMIENPINSLGALPINVLDIAPAHARDTKHDAPMPKELARWFILAATNPRETVLDPFAGSGTTLCVAEELGRNSIGIEIIPERAAEMEANLAGIRYIEHPMFA